MPQSTDVKVPDIGDFGDVEIIEVAVSPGDRVQVEQGLITLESSKDVVLVLLVRATSPTQVDTQLNWEDVVARKFLLG